MASENEIEVAGPLYGGEFALAGGGSAPFVLPGERLAGDAASPEIAEPSPDRVVPGCAHFGVCGGCQYQHAGYAAQLRLKTEVLSGTLAAAGLPTMPAPRISAGEPWGYRNRIRLRAEAGQLGYSRRGSREFLPIRMCPIAAPLLWHAAESLLALALAEGFAARWLANTAELELFTTGDETRLQLQFFLREPAAAQRDAPGFAALCERLKARVPALAGAGAELHPERNRRSRRAWAGVAWGAPGLEYRVGERPYWVARGAFFQVNRFLVERLLALATEGLTGELAWDLFAGVGLFTLPLAEQFGRVVAVEGAPEAAAALAIASRKHGFLAVQQPAQTFLAARALDRDRPDLVLLDPPRAGLGSEGAAVLARLRPRRIVYVSCDPQTLARDLRVLAAAGYAVTALDLIDLFPQTFHLETVVRLRLA